MELVKHTIVSCCDEFLRRKSDNGSLGVACFEIRNELTFPGKSLGGRGE